MANRLLIISFFLLSNFGYSQLIFEDALTLRSYVDENGVLKSAPRDQDAFLPILKNYFKTNPVNNYSDLLNSLETGGSNYNPFLYPLLDKGYVVPAAPHSTPGPIPSALGAVGGLDVTNFALGLTDFLIARTKTELNTAFFKRLNEELNKSDLNILFPNTVAILSTIGVEIYQYDLYLNNLRTAFEKDLKGLLDNVPEVLENHKSDLANVTNWGYPSVALSINMIQWVHRGYQPGEIVRLLGESEHIKSLSSQAIPDPKSSKGMKYAANGIQTISLLSESFRSSDTASAAYWVTKNKLEKLKDPVVVRIYLGLLFEVIKKDYNKVIYPTSGGKDTTLLDVLTHIGENWDKESGKALSFVKGMGENINAVRYAVNEYDDLKNNRLQSIDLDPKERNKLLFDAYYSVFSSTINLVNYTYRIEELTDKIKIPEDAKKIVNYLEYGGELSVQVINKQYAGAVSNAGMLLNEAFAPVYKKKPELQIVVAKTLKYGSFMAALVEAERPEEAKAAIEAVALPPGSYTVKRESRFNVALNGYLGGFYGYEDNKGVNDGSDFNNLALTAPVGISLSWGNQEFWGITERNPWSFGFSFPILDLGNIASYRIDEPDNVESVPTIQLKDIVSPGAFLELGIGGTPLTVAGGVQLGSRLRKIEPGAESNQIDEMYWRYGVSVKVDIPIVNFYASPVTTQN